MKIACVQMNIVFGEPERNYEIVREFIAEAASDRADIIVLPEMWNTGYALTELETLADENGQKTKLFLQKLANQYKVNIVGGSVAIKRGEQFFNTMYVVNRSGAIVAEYDKAHLFKLMDEHQFMNAGGKANLFELDGTKCGGAICYDLRFPEWIRTHVLDGANIMFIPAEWPKPRIDHWQLLLQARAIENQCFIVAVNRVGKDPNNEFVGHSMIIGPWGELLLKGQTGEGIFYADIDLSEVDSVRKRIPVFQDRRTDLY